METIARKLIRPRRGTYLPSHDLGPSPFIVKGVLSERFDRTLTNSHGYSLECSWFSPVLRKGAKKGPCLIYCHGNCGTRLDALDLVPEMLPLGISVFAFDFAGSGRSGGQYVSLGFYEKEDIKTVVTYLRKSEEVECISLWGRSMGAVAVILYAAEDPFLTFLAMDSPFTSLVVLIKEQIANMKWIPNSIATSVLLLVRTRIKEVAEFDIEDVNPIQVLSRCRPPCVFIHSHEDALVSLQHSLKLFSLYPNRLKQLYQMEGGHNTPRPSSLHESMGKAIIRLSRKTQLIISLSLPDIRKPEKSTPRSIGSRQKISLTVLKSEGMNSTARTQDPRSTREGTEYSELDRVM